MTSRRRGERSLFWGAVLAIVAADALTKAVAVASLRSLHGEVPVLGDWVRWRLVYNPGAAFGIHAGPWSRVIFTVLTVVALGILARVYQTTRPGDRGRLLAVALVTGGAVGNLVDRLRSALGVVDFIDVGLGDLRWPTFNVADIAVSTGALLLAWVLWSEEEPEGARADTAPLEPLGATSDGSGG
ncbi:MAG: signal peptidase II [Gemmatimonadetes bacterium]|nr:signal peptidase II [Gemmatimonadota bacterium]